MKAVDRRPNRGCDESAPWWTEECKVARLNYRAVVANEERVYFAKLYRAKIVSAKKEYWRRKVEGMKTSSDIFKLVRWAAPRKAKILPLILHEGQLISDQAEITSILRDCLLARYDAADDLTYCSIPGKNLVLWTNQVTETEVRKCTIGSGNSCAGADVISVELLATCWDSIGNYVTQIFHSCLRLGHHPYCLKLAEIVYLPKKGRDPCSIKAGDLFRFSLV